MKRLLLAVLKEFADLIAGFLFFLALGFLILWLGRALARLWP